MKKPLLRCLALLIGLLLGLALSEALLRWKRLPLPFDLATYLFGCYEPAHSAQSIFNDCPLLAMKLGRPHLQTGCYFLGHHWHHQSDRYGFRNPKSWEEADIVLLGDSMIYGHGVEEHQTVAYFLRHQLKLKVVNQGLTGTCPVHYLGILQNFSLPLMPRVAVVFIFGNDLRDLESYYRPKELLQITREARSAETRLFQRNELLQNFRVPPPKPWLEHLLSYKAAQFYIGHIKVFQPDATPQPAPTAQLPYNPQAAARFASYYKRSIDYLRLSTTIMAQSCKASGTNLVMAYLPGRHWRETGLGHMQHTDRYLPRILAQIAHDQRIHFFDATSALTNSQGVPTPGTWLPRDYHLNEAGHRALAQGLGRFLEQHKLIQASSSARSTLAINMGTRESSHLLGQGWSGPETLLDRTPVIWSEGARSSIIFLFHGARQSYNLRLRVIPFSGAMPQHIQIFLNRHRVASVTLENQWQEYTIPLAPGMFSREKNTLSFEYARTARPVDSISGSPDKRQLGVMFETIHITPKP